MPLAAVLLGGATDAARASALLPAALPQCDRTNIRVAGANAADFKDVCDGGLAAFAFLGKQGLAEHPELVVEVTSNLSDIAGSSAAGCFLEEKSRAYVVTFTEFKKKTTWFGVPITRELYRSLAAHEVAHAVAAYNFTVKEPSIQAKEYVAYIAMFSTMPAPIRARALASLPGQGFTNVARVSSFVYLFDPMRFGAEAYRHFKSLDDGPAFLESVMSGKALSD